MTLILALLGATLFLAYNNGANDNFKGVASLFGSNTVSYRVAITWATVTTFSGSMASFFLAQTLIKMFSGKGLVPDELVGSHAFLSAVALGAGITVWLATLTGFPISTTHSLTGAIVGAGLMAVGLQVNFALLTQKFLLPLFISPVAAVLLAFVFYYIFRAARLRLGIEKEYCVCIGREKRLVPIAQPASALALQPAAEIAMHLGPEAQCSEQYAGRYWGLNCQRTIDAAHFLSAGVVCFARGLNDTPKIAALLLVVQALDLHLGIALVGVAMAVGGLLNARRVAETISRKMTTMNHGQAFAANLATGVLVVIASKLGYPVSTTHVSVGSLAGIGVITRQANLKVIVSILCAWFITLPCAALFAGLAFALM